MPPIWRQFHARLQLQNIPSGYFGVFRELADFVLTAIQGGLTVDHKTVPDISVGQIWGKYWEAIDGDRRFGDRIRHDHNYPDDFPQAASNPQPIWVYPVAALGEFRTY